jgi:hypothetical protein
MTTPVSICDLDRLNLTTYIGRFQLQQNLHSLGVPDDVARWVSDFAETQERRVKEAFQAGKDDNDQ